MPSNIADDVKKVAKSMKFHMEHDSLSGVPHYHARSATLHVRDSLAVVDFQHAMSVVLCTHCCGSVSYSNVLHGAAPDTYFRTTTSHKGRRIPI